MFHTITVFGKGVHRALLVALPSPGFMCYLTLMRKSEAAGRSWRDIITDADKRCKNLERTQQQ
jgi:hypothetical protein